jgi:rsbT co-antagonist protein RsbR
MTTDSDVQSFTTSADVAARLERYSITEEDLERIRSYGAIAIPKLDALVDGFYGWLERQPEFEEFFSDPEVLRRVKGLIRGYWADFFEGQVTDEYVESRITIGETHSRIGLPLRTYFAAMNTTFRLITEDLYDGSLEEGEYAAALRSVAKLLHFDTAVVGDTYTQREKATIGAQSRALMEMSTPVTQIWDGILLLPLVGIIDSRRAQDVMDATLSKISQALARVFILDISGVGVVDTAVANHLIKITKATRLMGCECTISGLSPAIANTMVELGIDVGTVKTTGTMQDALADAFKSMGVQIALGR